MCLNISIPLRVWYQYRILNPVHANYLLNMVAYCTIHDLLICPLTFVLIGCQRFPRFSRSLACREELTGCWNDCEHASWSINRSSMLSVAWESGDPGNGMPSAPWVSAHPISGIGWPCRVGHGLCTSWGWTLPVADDMFLTVAAERGACGLAGPTLETQ